MATEPEKEVDLHALYAELLKTGHKGDYNKVIKAADNILEHDPNEKEAFHYKIVALIHLSKFKEALVLLESKKELSQDLIFERGYCYYRNNEVQKAYDVVSSCPELTNRDRELLCQILYRLERYEECYELYKDLIKKMHDNYEDERSVNLSATIAQLSLSSKYVNEPLLEQDHTYELCFNAACKLAYEGKYTEAMEKLGEAEQLCIESLEQDDATEEEIIDELTNIRAQRAYCLQMLGRMKEAQEIYVEILKMKSGDKSVQVVVNNNSAVANKNSNMFDSKRRLRSCLLSEGDKHKLTITQRAIVAYNNCIFSSYGKKGQNEFCIQTCDKFGENHPSMAEEAAIIKATVLSKSPDCLAEGLGILEEFAAKNPKAKKCRLAAAQILLNNNKRKEAREKLESILEEYDFDIVNGLISLYEGDGDKKSAIELLERAVEWQTKQRMEDAVLLKSTLKLAADRFMQLGDTAAACKCWDRLLDIYPDDMQIIAKAVIAYAEVDGVRAEKLCQKLPPIPLNEETAENLLSDAPNVKKDKKPYSKMTPKPSSGKETKRLEGMKKKRKRKPKLPKNYDPNVAPDPERWLPKYERSNYKKKRDRRYRDRDGVGKGTQGAAGGSDQYDITKMQAQSKSTPPSKAVQHNRLQKDKMPFQKKKKGGRR